MDEPWQVWALKYAERNARSRADSFEGDDHASPHPMDYFLWVLRNDTGLIVVDTGYDAAEGARRGRPVLRDPARALADAGIDAARVDRVIVTHLHYDHAGTLDAFPAATFHVQAAEMAFATGPCMCDPTVRAPFTADHVCALVRRVFAGRVVFHDGAGQVAPGVEVHGLGGHSAGLQCVRVRTARGWLVLASDAAHYYENFLARRVFPIVHDRAAMAAGWDRIVALADGDPARVIPGHDPLVRAVHPCLHRGADGTALHRLDLPPAPALGTEIDRLRH